MTKYNTSVSLSSSASMVNWNLGRIIMLNLARFGVGLVAFIVGMSLMTSAMTGFVTGMASLGAESLSSFEDLEIGELLEEFSEVLSLSDVISDSMSFWRILAAIATLFLALYTLFFIPIGLCSIVGSIFTPGYHNGLIKLAQSENVKASVLLSRLRHFLASIGLPLWRSLKTWLWAIPGLAIMVLGNTITISTLIEEGEIYASFSAPSGLSGAIMPYGLTAMDEFYFGDFLWFCGLGVLLALVIPASLRYAMAPYVYAETPAIGVYDAIEYSKAVMNYRCTTLFMVILPYLLIDVAIGVAYYFLTKWMFEIDFGAFTGIVSNIIQYSAIIGFVYVGFLRDVAYVNFYLENKV